MDLNIDVVETKEAFCLLKDDWERILSENDQHHFYLSYDWFYAVLHFYHDPPKAIRVFRIHENGRVIAIIPCCLARQKLRLFTLPTLQIIGSKLSSFAGCIVAKGWEGAVAMAFSDFLFECSEWKALCFDNISESDVFIQELICTLKKKNARVKSNVHLVWNCWGADSSSMASSQEYWNSLSDNKRRKIRRIFNKFNRSGDFEVVLIGSPGQDVDKAMVQYADICAGSWKTTDEEPVFQHRLAKYLLDNGCLRIFLLYHRDQVVKETKPKPFSPQECLVISEELISGKPIAAQFVIVRGTHAFFIRTAYLEDYASYSPGTLLMWFILKRLIDVDHVRYIDFLKGDNPFKSDWGKIRDRLMICFVSNPRSLRAHFELWFKIHVFPKFRKLMLSLKHVRYYNKICDLLHFKH
jgi:hypothetical protein